MRSRHIEAGRDVLAAELRNDTVFLQLFDLCSADMPFPPVLDAALLAITERVFVAVELARDPCRWSDQGEYWQSECGEAWNFEADGPHENGCKFCHGCGNPIEVVRRALPSWGDTL